VIFGGCYGKLLLDDRYQAFWSEASLMPRPEPIHRHGVVAAIVFAAVLAALMWLWWPF
jgi:hypothetical protein